jgi:hypothetical protein
MRSSVVRLPAKTAPETGERLRPLWIPQEEAVTVDRAVEMFKRDYHVSRDTVRRLVLLHRLHTQTGHRGLWRISAPGLAMALAGDVEAIELLRQDDREHPDVARYFKRLGIPLP